MYFLVPTVELNTCIQTCEPMVQSLQVFISHILPDDREDDFLHHNSPKTCKNIWALHQNGQLTQPGFLPNGECYWITVKYHKQKVIEFLSTKSKQK